MARIIKPITVDVARENLFEAIIAKQHDSNSRFLKVSFVNEGESIPIGSSSSVTINAERADGQSKSFLGEINDDGTVTVPLTTWMLELDDYLRCDISVVDSEARKLTSTNFSIKVEAASNFDENISEDENYDVLIKLLADVNIVKDSAISAAKAANSAAEKFEEAIASLEETQYLLYWNENADFVSEEQEQKNLETLRELKWNGAQSTFLLCGDKYIPLTNHSVVKDSGGAGEHSIYQFADIISNAHETYELDYYSHPHYFQDFCSYRKFQFQITMQVVDELPSDAADHPNVLYIVPEAEGR